jgi:glyoxylase-like metal-dependent hydrolase (beta-lactamase superfamily II)
MMEEHRDDRLLVRRLSVGPYDNNVYVVGCARTGRAVIVDAAAEPDRILEACRDLEVIEILTTHGHADHLGAVDRVADALGVRWRMHPADVEIAGRRPDDPIRDGEEIPIGDVALHAIHTPGHTPGSVCFVVEPFLFSGDTLFPGGPGATRWEYSSFGQIMDSLERKLFTLPDPTVVYPGHGAETTLGEERPHLPEWRARGW